MSPLVLGDDGLDADEVGSWAKEKHDYLCRYLNASSSARKKYLGAGKAGATFVDFFSASGRAKIRDTAEFVDGSPVAAWKAGATGRAPFGMVYIADIDSALRKTCARRLSALGAPHRQLMGDAVEAASEYVGAVNPAGLHLAFLDPFGIGDLDFRIIEKLAELQRVDMLIHVSAMDLQRNLLIQINDEDAHEFDVFAPGWRAKVSTSGTQLDVRARLLEYWSGLVRSLGMRPFTDTRLIKGSQGQRLYWLILASRSALAQALWKKIGRADRQGVLL